MVRRRHGNAGRPVVRRPAVERRATSIDEGLRSEREVLAEPCKIDEVSCAGVVDVAGQGQGMELLGDVLRDGVDRVAVAYEAEPLDDRVGEVFLEVADDDVGCAHVDLELDQLQASPEPLDRDDQIDPSHGDPGFSGLASHPRHQTRAATGGVRDRAARAGSASGRASFAPVPHHPTERVPPTNTTDGR